MACTARNDFPSLRVNTASGQSSALNCQWKTAAFYRCLVENRTGYKNLCELLTQAHLRSEKGKCAVRWDELAEFAQGLVALFGLGSAGASPAVSRASRDTSSGLFGGGAEKCGRGARGPQTIANRARFLIDVIPPRKRFR